MENRVRDLEQIQERDGEDRGRRIGAVLMAALALVGLTFAMGVVVGRAAEPEAEQTADPLAKLERNQASGTLLKDAPKAPKVEPAQLSFPETLTEAEERPEVLRALELAAQEEAALARAQQGIAPAEPAPEPEPALEPDAHEPEREVADPELAESDVTTQELVASVPAAVAAGAAGRSLPKAIRHDPLVASAIREDAPDLPAAAHGHDGEFTLQVISYDSPEPAREFAAGLRDKGHEAFVTAAEIEERGRYYRVRIGPFKNRMQAEVYRRKFEQDEQMNTFVVKRKDDDGA